WLRQNRRFDDFFVPGSRRAFGRGRHARYDGRLLGGVVDQNDEALEVQLRDGRERGKVLEGRLVDDVVERSLAVEQAEDAVELVGDFVEAHGERRVVHLEDGIEGRELLEEPSPLVE